MSKSAEESEDDQMDECEVCGGGPVLSYSNTEKDVCAKCFAKEDKRLDDLRMSRGGGTGASGAVDKDGDVKMMDSKEAKKEALPKPLDLSRVRHAETCSFANDDEDCRIICHACNSRWMKCNKTWQGPEMDQKICDPCFKSIEQNAERHEAQCRSGSQKRILEGQVLQECSLDLCKVCGKMDLQCLFWFRKQRRENELPMVWACKSCRDQAEEPEEFDELKHASHHAPWCGDKACPLLDCATCSSSSGVCLHHPKPLEQYCTRPACSQAHNDALLAAQFQKNVAEEQEVKQPVEEPQEIDKKKEQDEQRDQRARKRQSKRPMEKDQEEHPPKKKARKTTDT